VENHLQLADLRMDANALELDAESHIAVNAPIATHKFMLLLQKLKLILSLIFNKIVVNLIE
jgi:hypothetical protein